jgi:hypothetical protein
LKKEAKTFALGPGLRMRSGPPGRGTISKSFCFFFQKEALSFLQSSGAGLSANRSRAQAATAPALTFAAVICPVSGSAR